MDITSAIILAAKTVGISSSLLLAVCQHESGLSNVTVENDKGTPSIGTCQVKLETAFQMGFHGTRKQLEDPKVNALYSAKYLKWQLDQYSGDVCKAVAAYNSGSYSESRHRPGVPRNIKYVKEVQKLIKEESVAAMLECNQYSSKLADGI
jgi:soluble lytic murein transglycosylase-like protein